MPDLYSYLWDIHTALKRRGQTMDDATLREVAQRVSHPDVMRAMASGQLTGEQIADQAMQALQESSKSMMPMLSQTMGMN